jgi:4,5-dihydroxyphthalate decarboxylase
MGAQGDSRPDESSKESKLMSKSIPLTFAVAEMPHTSAIRSGDIRIDGVDGTFLTIHPQIAAFRRMVRDVEFDVCELAPTTYIIARAYGAPFVALPIFVLRKFHHSGLLVRPDSGISHPKDLEGKKVGVRAFSVTTGAWTRQAFIDDYGLDCSKVTWVVDDEEHVTQLKLPANVIRCDKSTSLNEMMAKGELMAGFGGNAGVGRTGNPTDGWKQVAVDYPDLFPDPEPIEADFFRRTGVYPMHGTIVVKEQVLKDNPGLAKAMYEAFDENKRQWLASLDSGEAQTASDQRYRKLQPLVGSDPLPYGIEANIKTIMALEKTAFDQGLTPRRMSMEELFVDPAKL